jgi:hypothetical protein
VVGGDYAGGITVWDGVTGEVLRDFNHLRQGVKALAGFETPEGQPAHRLVAAGFLGGLQVCWGQGDRCKVWAMGHLMSGGIVIPPYSRSGLIVMLPRHCEMRMGATVDWQVYDPATGELLHELTGHEDIIQHGGREGRENAVSAVVCFISSWTPQRAHVVSANELESAAKVGLGPRSPFPRYIQYHRSTAHLSGAMPPTRTHRLASVNMVLAALPHRCGTARRAS